MCQRYRAAEEPDQREYGTPCASSEIGTAQDGISAMERRAIVIRGIVQGVGFRPFVYNLTTRFGLGGVVQNQTGSLWIEVEGEPSSLEPFLAELTSNPPPLAQIEHLSWEQRSSCGEQRFRFEPSGTDLSRPVFLSPDVATCPDCLAELFNPADRRYLYPFLNCTNYGPRLTIILAAPYDRQRTTMASFPLCPACRAEYEDPTNRRFHAQPTACAVCGPNVRLWHPRGSPNETGDPLGAFVRALPSSQFRSRLLPA